MIYSYNLTNNTQFIVITILNRNESSIYILLNRCGSMCWRQILSLLIFIRARPFVSQVLFQCFTICFRQVHPEFYSLLLAYEYRSFPIPFLALWKRNKFAILFFPLNKYKTQTIFFFFFFIIDRSNQVSIGRIRGRNGSLDDEK